LCFKKISKNHFLSILTALLFGIFAPPFQATAWVIADLGTHLSTALALVALLVLSSNTLVLSAMLLLISLSFKEITIGSFLVFPLYQLLFLDQQKQKKHKSKKIYIFPAFGLFYLLTRLIISTKSTSSTNSNPIILDSTVRNFLNMPSKVLLQSFIPQQYFSLYYSLNSNYPFLLLILAVSLVLFIIIKHNSNNNAKIALFSLAWIVLNSLVFTITPEKSGEIILVDSRNLYFASIGTAYLLAAGIKSITKKPLIIFLPLIIFHAFFLNKYLNEFTHRGSTRKHILEKIYQSIPPNQKEIIVFTESDSSYYGLPADTRILPFQSGFGHTLLMYLYSKNYKFPPSFYENRFLWEITAQNTRQEGEYAYGYYFDPQKLLEEYPDDIKINALYSFSYSSGSERTKETSTICRGWIEGYKTSKTEVNSDFSLYSPLNSDSLKNIYDKNTQTYWDSMVPCSQYQYIDLSFPMQKQFVGLNINSSGRSDQDKVGYRILISQEGITWNKVFDSEAYPPDASGNVNIFFTPTIGRYVRIEQIGSHKYANWQISELTVYEAKD
jgi:hypothetical protein